MAVNVAHSGSYGRPWAVVKAVRCAQGGEVEGCMEPVFKKELPAWETQDEDCAAVGLRAVIINIAVV